jgi:hypothetical protein
MNKKGSTMIIMIVFELVIVLIVGGMLISTAKSFGESTTSTKINLAQDITMMVETLVSVSGDAVVKYPYEIDGFTLVLSSGSVFISLPDEPKNKKIFRNFVLPKGFKSVGIIENSHEICLEKKEKVIELRDCNEQESTV